MTDKGTGAENLIWLAGRQSGRPDSALLAADDILAALTGRIAELEARVSAILAEVEPQLPSAGSKQGAAPSSPKPDAGRGTDEIRDARVSADAELTRASEERRMLANEMRLLREAIQEARHSPLPVDPRANSAQAQVARDPSAAIADEMRSLLTELLADFRSRAAAAPPVTVAPPPVKAELVVGAPPAVEFALSQPVIDAEIVNPPVDEIRDVVVEDVEVAPLPADLATKPAPPLIDTVEPLVEHVDELIKPAAPDEFIEYDEYIDDLPMPEPVGHLDVSPILESAPEPAATIEEIELTAAPPEPAPPIVDEPVFEAAEHAAPILDERLEAIRWTEPPLPIETIELGSAPVEPAEPMVEDVEEILQTEVLPPVESLDVMPAPTDPADAVVEEYVEELRQSEPIVEYLTPAPDVTVTPPAGPPAVDSRIEAMWDAAPSPPSFVPEEFVAETPSLDVADALPTSGPPLELVPEPPLEFVPEPPVVFTPEPPIVFAAEPPIVFAPEPPMQFAVEPPAVIEPQPEATYAPAFPELRVSADEGLHEIQVVISPIHSFPRLLETERRIRALSTVNALHLRDFRNGVATLTVSVGEAISPAEFGAVIQMLEDLHLRLEGTTLSSVELRAEADPPTE